MGTHATHTTVISRMVLCLQNRTLSSTRLHLTISQAFTLLMLPTAAHEIATAQATPASRSAPTQPSVSALLSRILVDSGKYDFSGGAPALIRPLMLGVDRKTGNLVSQDLRTGESRTVLTGDLIYALGPTSRDQRAVAYTACTRGAVCDYELRSINVDGSGKRTIIAFGGAIDWIVPYSWSPDGRRILGVVALHDKRRQIAFVSIANGAINVVKALEWREPSGVALSPGGDYVAYDFQAERDKGARDLVVLNARTRAEARITIDSVPKSVVGWSADGAGVFYTTVENDSTTLWVVPVRNGRRSGPSKRLRRDLGAASDFRVAGQSLEYRRVDTRKTIFDIAVDLDAGTAGISTVVAASSEITGWALLSPDGNRVAFTRLLNSAGDRVAVSLADLHTRDERTFPFTFESIRLDHWFPDGQSLAVVASLRGKEAHYRVNFSTTGARETAAAVLAEALLSAAPVRSPEGSTDYFVARDATSDSNRVVARDVLTGRERTLVTRYGALEPLRLSPDGRSLAVPVGGPRSQAKTTPGFIVITTGGDSRELFASGPSLSVGQNSLVWSVDSRHVLFRVAAGTNDGQENQLWTATPGSNAARRLVVEARDAFRERSIQIAPDGRHLVYTVQPDSRISEIWLIENLPGSRATPVSRRQ